MSLPAPSRRVRLTVALGGLALVLLALVDVVAASNVVAGLEGQRGDVAVPTWLFLLTGGAVIAASAMLSMLMTDRQFVGAYHTWSKRPTVPYGDTVLAAAGAAGAVLSALALVLVVYTGFTGPSLGSASLAVLFVFVGIRSGLTIVAYLVGNPWPTINPWRRVTERLPNGFVEYPDVGRWPAVAALLALIWIEVIAPVTEAPAVLAWGVVGYSLYTLAGAVLFSPETWFRHADPLSLWFRFYGAVGPLQRGEEGWSLRLPGARLGESELLADRSGVAFVVLLVWELTFSGLIVTPPGVSTVESLVGAGIPPLAAYLLLLVAGYGLFLGLYRLASRLARRRAETYLSVRTLGLRFAPPLLAIAAGYHLAHYFNFFIALSPSLWTAVTNPLSPPAPPAFTQVVLPAWVDLFEVAFVLAGHVLAVWVAHATSFDLFPGRLQAIRSQIPFVAVMVLYTMVSLWLLSMPTVELPYVQT
jgi:hypothetical protein